MFDDKYFMELALRLAASTLGQTLPNPCVGAVVVKNNQILGYGAHLHAGCEHAEIIALRQAGDEAEDATLYVTLEPCNHFGKTPPCTAAIINSNVKKVVVATLDVNPQVSGSGIKKLQAAGIEVEVGLLEHDAKQLNQMFFHYIKNKAPYITLKCGVSLDAKLATSNGESRWITSLGARLDAHNYRHTHDAILVGVSTVLADNPKLTTRLPNGNGKNPIRVVLDTNLRTPLDSHILTEDGSRTWIVVGSQVDEIKIIKYKSLGVEIVQMPTPRIDLQQLMLILGQRQITSLLVEGGHTVHTSFIQAKLFNQVVLYISPLLIGGITAPQFFAGTGFVHLKDAINLEYVSTELIDGNLKIIAQPASSITASYV
jgi:diaminohydroxyphosphoribosylaminopyrimidine deaminase / 5-amino-6-(5-phosphoribosylamino)uracil reductase